MSSIVYENLEVLGATIGEKIGAVRLCRAEDGGRRGPARYLRRGESRPAGRRARRHRPGSCAAGAQPLGTPGGGRQGLTHLHRRDATAHLVSMQLLWAPVTGDSGSPGLTGTKLAPAASAGRDSRRHLFTRLALMP